MSRGLGGWVGGWVGGFFFWGEFSHFSFVDLLVFLQVETDGSSVWVGGWVGGCVRYILLERSRRTRRLKKWVGGWVGGWVGERLTGSSP